MFKQCSCALKYIVNPNSHKNKLYSENSAKNVCMQHSAETN